MFRSASVLAITALLFVGLGCAGTEPEPMPPVGNNDAAVNAATLVPEGSEETSLMLSSAARAAFATTPIVIDSTARVGVALPQTAIDDTSYDYFYSLDDPGRTAAKGHVELGKTTDMQVLRGYFRLPPPADGVTYEGWLLGTETNKRLRVGELTYDVDAGYWRLAYGSAKENLFAFDAFVVTNENAQGGPVTVLEGFGGTE